MKKIFLILLFLLSGCSLLTFKEPKVELKEVKVTKTSLREIGLNFNLAIDNPNDREFLVDKISYLIEMEDGKLTEGEILGPWRLEKKTVTPVDLPVTLKTGDIIEGIARVLEGKKELLVTGTISAKNLKVPFKTKKKIEL